jgi:Tfp pilus assembly protein PilO
MYNLIFERIFKRWSGLNNEVVLKKTELRRDIKLLENRNNIISGYNTYAKSIKNISNILGYVQKLADSCAIRTANIRPNPLIQKELYKQYTIELQVEGSFLDITKFLNELIKSPLFITIEKFDLRAQRETPSYFKGTLILSKIII